MDLEPPPSPPPRNRDRPCKNQERKAIEDRTFRPRARARQPGKRREEEEEEGGREEEKEQEGGRDRNKTIRTKMRVSSLPQKEEEEETKSQSFEKEPST